MGSQPRGGGIDLDLEMNAHWRHCLPVTALSVPAFLPMSHDSSDGRGCGRGRPPRQISPFLNLAAVVRVRARPPSPTVSFVQLQPLRINFECFASGEAISCPFRASERASVAGFGIALYPFFYIFHLRSCFNETSVSF